METQLEYVRRKLNDPKMNIKAVGIELGINRYRLDKIAKGGDTNYALVESLYIFFKASAE
jgi:hypothetical protein